MRALLVGLVCVVGCGIGHSQSLDDGGASQNDGGGGGGGDSGGGVSDAGLVPACPKIAPADGTACSKPGLECEYGSDPNIECNTVARCQGSYWSTAASRGGECPTPPPGSKSCASTYAQVPVGEACPYQGLECGYPEGYCVCTEPFSGPPRLDASNSQVWVCDTPSQGCPSPRPRTGSACSAQGQYCDYGGCSLPGGVVMQCESGIWTEQQIACPL